jgi:hypothetical protein
MALLYFVHITTEARSRTLVDMGSYAILFQAYVPVIAILDIVVYRAIPGIIGIVGALLLLYSSSGILILESRFTRKDKRRRLTRKAPNSPRETAAQIGLLSAVACGFALYIDGEIGRNYLLPIGHFPSFVPYFLFYETLTFALPAAVAILWLARSESIRNLFHCLAEEFRKDKRGYALASLFSSSQFVFSVLALSLPAPRIISASVLASAPILTLIISKRKGPVSGAKVQYGLAVAGGIGFILLALR